MKRYCDNIKGIPTNYHYAVLIQDQVHIPGDERSRTNPGHGYPAETRTYFKYIAFDDKQEWEDWIKENAKNELNKNFVAFANIKPASIKKNIVISVE